MRRRRRRNSSSDGGGGGMARRRNSALSLVLLLLGQVCFVLSPSRRLVEADILWSQREVHGKRQTRVLRGEEPKL